MAKIQITCKNCDSIDSEKQPVYRRETIDHSKKCKWISMPMVYCKECGAISVYSTDYKEAVIVLKTKEEKEQEYKEALEREAEAKKLRRRRKRKAKVSI